MVRAVATDAALAEFLADARRNAVLIGPGAGVGATTAATVLTVLASPAAAVLDADALTSFARTRKRRRCGPPASASSCAAPSRDPTRHGLFAAIKAQPGAGRAHAARGRVQAPVRRAADRLQARTRPRAPRAASGAVVVLKGPDTVIAAPDGRAAINDNAPPWLATAGSGDVLAGLVAGLLAQRMPAVRGRLRRGLAARRVRQRRSARA